MVVTDHAVEESHEARERCEVSMAERNDVPQRPDRMMVDEDSIESDRRIRPRSAALERAVAQRDASPTGFTRYSTEALFVREDPRRTADSEGGRNWYPFGTDWRRDGDDDNRGKGTWTLWWLATTQETVLERRAPRWELWLLGTAIASFDQAQTVLHSIEPLRPEPNSVAVVLDVYRAVDGLNPKAR